MASRSSGLILVAIAALSACGPVEPAIESRLTVFAAAGLTDAITHLHAELDEPRPVASFGPTSVLARQIADGAPADVFLSANRRWMEWLETRGMIAGDPVVFARGRIVCIAPPRRSLKARDVRELIDNLDSGDRIAIADAGVPAGDYARAALTAAGTLTSLHPHLVGFGDVRAVLRAVLSGGVTAGFVYATDARAADLAPCFALDDATHPPVTFLAAALTGSPRSAQALTYLRQLGSPASRRRLAAAGFEVETP